MRGREREMFYRIIREMIGQKCRSQKIVNFHTHTSGTWNDLSTGPLISVPINTDKNKTYIFQKGITYPLSKMPSNSRRKGFTRIVLTVGSSFNLRSGMDNKIMEENSPFLKAGGVGCVVLFRRQQSKLPADSNNQSNYPWQFNSQWLIGIIQYHS